MDTDSSRPYSIHLRISPLLWLGCFFILPCIFACTSGEIRHTQKVKTTDSLPFMHSVGVSTLISDSGVIRYHLVAEEWDIYTPNNQAATWKFIKGLLMLRLDEELDVDLYVQADTAYLHQQRTWELRGRVRIRNVQGTKFNTEELFWDLNKHEMWNHAYMTIITPERTLEGTEFRSNEQMTRYSVANSKGEFPMSDADGGTAAAADTPINADSMVQGTEKVTVPVPATQQHIPIKPRNPNAAPVKSLPPAPTKYDFKKEK